MNSTSNTFNLLSELNQLPIEDRLLIVESIITSVEQNKES
jgi:hypothetical protein